MSTLKLGAAGKALLEGVGNTPLVNLSDLPGVPAGVSLFAKLESVNPGGSIKDRPVSRMITRAIEAGHLDGGRRLLDSSSGNAGIAYALFGAALGVSISIVVPGNASRERLDRIAAHGAELILTDPIEGYDFALRTAKRLAAEQPERYWYSNQYANENNWKAHYETTGQEILDQVAAATGGALPDAFIAGVGTGGTITGVGRRLRVANPQVHIASVIPDIFPGLEGLKPLGHEGDIVPDILDESLIDARQIVPIEDALETCRMLAKSGLYVGPSSGAYVYLALKVAATGRYQRLVTILNDTGERYVSTGMWGRDSDED
ncbi:MAG: cysteine synthase family protein [Myxococcales bacterium]|nr:cysteine synthase family protein [Myxococcales bacterium]